MTAHKITLLRAGGVPVHELLTANLPLLVDRVLERLVAEIPLYSQLPHEELHGDIRRVIDQTLRTFIDTFRSRSVPPTRAFDPMRESAIRRAEEGVPLEALLAAYHLGGGVCADFVGERFRPDELADALALNRLVLDFLQVVTAEVSASYFEERQTMAGDDQATRQSLLAALLQDGPADEIAHKSGLRLPEQYVVLGLAIGPHPDESEPGTDPRIAARRKLRRIRIELERIQAMATLSTDGGLTLIPHPAGDLEALRHRLSRAAGVEVSLAHVDATRTTVPAAATLVRELLEVIRIYDRPAGTYGLDDLVLEYQLSRPSPARDRLAAALDPLRDRPELLETLRTYLDTGRSRRRTATALHVHANTVDYRLRQVGRLTGLDPAQPDQLPRLIAAMAGQSSYRSSSSSTT